MQINKGKCRRFLIALAIASLVSFSFCSCIKNKVPIDKVCVGEAFLSDTLSLEVEEESSFPFFINSLDNFEVKLQEENENAKIHDGEIILKFDKTGEYSIPLALSADGYAETSARLNIIVEPHEMSLEALLLPSISDKETAKPIPNDELTIENGLSTALLIASENNAKLDISCDERFVSYELNGDVLTLKGERAGETTIRVKSSLPNYKNAQTEFRVKVIPQKVKLNLDRQDITLGLNEKIIIDIDMSSDCNIDVSCPTDLINAVIVDNKLSLTAVGYGNANVTILASKEGFTDNKKSIHINIPYPKTQLVANSDYIELKNGEVGLMEFDVNYNDARLSAETVVGDAMALITGNKLQVTAGNDEYSKIKIIAENKNGGRAESFVDVFVANDFSVLPEDKMARGVLYYTNLHRLNCGEKPLRYIKELDKASSIRAREAELLWSHTRPSGNSFYEVFVQFDMAKKYGFTGENLFRSDYEPTPKDIVEKWIASPGHEKNLRRHEFNGISINFYDNQKGMYYCSQLFVEE